MSPASLRVLVADDHAILRAGLKRLLLEMPGVEEVGEAENGAQVLRQLRSQQWDVLVLDLDMPAPNSLDLLRHVKSLYPATAVLVLSLFSEQQYALRAVKNGAAGYLNKQCAPEQLLTAIRRVSEGGTYISASVAADLVGSSGSSRTDAVNEVLSDRELTVLQGIVAGKSLTRIGEELTLSAKTVSTYRARLLTKLRLKSNVELARYAIESGLIK